MESPEFSFLFIYHLPLMELKIILRPHQEFPVAIYSEVCSDRDE